MSWFRWITLSLPLFVSLTVAFRDGDVRLVNSIRYGEGRVEVFFMGAWGTICQRGWDFNDAQVICRQLGFPRGAQRAFSQARFGEGSGSVLLSDVDCQGDEDTLMQCGNVVWNSNTCNHQADVGVRCNAPNYEGCFSAPPLQKMRTTISNTLTLESCYGYCANTQYFWMEKGDSCSCGSSIQGQLPLNDGCNSPCIGDEDWICGGNGKASVYKAQVSLPYAASDGFPGRVTVNTNGNTWRFTAEGNWDYTFIQVHQFDIPSTNVSDFVTNSEMFEIIDGTSGVYLVSTDLAVIDVRYPGKSGVEDYPGFLLQFGQGMFCRPPPGLPNGLISSTSNPPFTVGDYFQVTCEPGHTAFDNMVFCQADGMLSRPIMCIAPDGPMTTPRVLPPGGPMTTERQPAILTGIGRCPVPVIENGKANATATREVLNSGETIQVTCNPIFDAVNSTATCQNNGEFSPTPKCQRNETLFTILIAVVCFVGLLVILLFVLLVGCACYFSQRKKSRVRDYQRRNNVEVISTPYGASNNAFESNEPVSFDEDDDVIIELPTTDAFPSAPSGSGDEATGGAPNNSAGLGKEEESALQGLNDVVNDLERDNMYRKVNKPTIAASGGFGGHFAQT